VSVEQDIRDYLKAVNPPPFERTTDPDSLKLRRVLDSLDMAELITFLERTFSIRVTDEDVLARNFDTVGSVVAFVKSRLGDS
jgi:acyl carrier protein